MLPVCADGEQESVDSTNPCLPAFDLVADSFGIEVSHFFP